MTHKRKAIILHLLICMLLTFTGCSRFTASSKKVQKTPYDLKKTKLLKQIDKKFENPQAHYELARLYQADGLWTKAEYHYNVTLGFDPVHRPAQAAMISVLLNAGDNTRAEILTDIYMNQAAHSATGSLVLAMAFQKQRLDDHAVAAYQQALRLAPSSAKINRQIGYYYHSKGEKDRARDYLTRSFQIDPKQPEVAGLLGRLGVAVEIPRKTSSRTGAIDKIIKKGDQSAN